MGTERRNSHLGKKKMFLIFVLSAPADILFCGKLLSVNYELQRRLKVKN